MIKLSVDLTHYSTLKNSSLPSGGRQTLCLQIVRLWSGLFMKKKRLKGFGLSQRKDGWLDKWIMGPNIGVRKPSTFSTPNRPLITAKTWCMEEGCHFFCSAFSSVTVSSCLSITLDWQAAHIRPFVSQRSSLLSVAPSATEALQRKSVCWV